MIAILAILTLTIYLIFFFPLEPRVKKEEEKSPKYAAQMKKLWQASARDAARKSFAGSKASGC